jgi:hypothetical protein
MHALTLLLLLCAAPQDPVPPPVEPPRTSGARPEPAPEPSKLVPGALPAKASHEARALWRRVVDATRAAGESPPPVSAFDLAFDLRTRREGRNDARLRFRYLERGFVRATLESGREHLRGPQGDFLIDGEQKLALADTRENEEDRRQIEEELAIARNFVALTDPGRLRVASLARLDAPPTGMPPELAQQAAALEWLEVSSPDFRLFKGEPGGATPLYLARLGVERASGRLALAQIGRDLRRPRPDERALLVDLRAPKRLDGWMIPHEIYVRTFDEELGRFEERPALELGLRSGSLRPALGPDDFRP